ncbi:hypothetical protein JW826_03000 [Candidatus Woesearchaeota archaeon]|nr:hypothetical protein [Candidatus Woesearchaeota archaeon]
MNKTRPALAIAAAGLAGLLSAACGSPRPIPRYKAMPVASNEEFSKALTVLRETGERSKHGRDVVFQKDVTENCPASECFARTNFIDRDGDYIAFFEGGFRTWGKDDENRIIIVRRGIDGPEVVYAFQLDVKGVKDSLAVRTPFSDARSALAASNQRDLVSALEGNDMPLRASDRDSARRMISNLVGKTAVEPRRTSSGPAKEKTDPVSGSGDGDSPDLERALELAAKYKPMDLWESFQAESKVGTGSDFQASIDRDLVSGYKRKLDEAASGLADADSYLHKAMEGASEHSRREMGGVEQNTIHKRLFQAEYQRRIGLAKINALMEGAGMHSDGTYMGLDRILRNHVTDKSKIGKETDEELGAGFGHGDKARASFYNRAIQNLTQEEMRISASELDSPVKTSLLQAVKDELGRYKTAAYNFVRWVIAGNGDARAGLLKMGVRPQNYFTGQILPDEEMTSYFAGLNKTIRAEMAPWSQLDAKGKGAEYNSGAAPQAQATPTPSGPSIEDRMKAADAQFK